MGLSIITPQNSFVRFDSDQAFHCIWGLMNTCLPVYLESDINFQFVIQGDTPEEIDALCVAYESGIAIGLVLSCEQEGFTVEFNGQEPDRFRISPLQLLYNWPHGFPGMNSNIPLESCFYIRIEAGELVACSTCFQRVPDDCFTSVIEYGNDENFAGFNYCNAGEIPGGSTITCEPQVYTFSNVATLTLPYTAFLASMFGEVPTVQAWLYDGDGNLTNMGIVATFDGMPPTQIHFDFGGVASGIIIIR